MTEHDAILTEQEVATMLKLRPSTVADLARRGVLPSIWFGRHRRYVAADIHAYVRRLGEQERKRARVR
jgi:excisionase family DNA binding protein